jgi:hypothetical protein
MSKIRDSKKRIAFVQLFSDVSSSDAVPDEIQVVPTGTWDHPVYGEMEITPADLDEFVQNFGRGIRRHIPITQGHDNGMSGGELPAVAKFTDLRASNTGLLAASSGPMRAAPHQRLFQVLLSRVLRAAPATLGFANSPGMHRMSLIIYSIKSSVPEALPSA